MPKQPAFPGLRDAMKIKARFSMIMRRAEEVGLWQPRFWEHHLRDQGGQFRAA